MPFDHAHFAVPPSILASLRLPPVEAPWGRGGTLSPGLRAAIFLLAALMHLALLQGLVLWTPDVARLPEPPAALQVRLLPPRTMQPAPPPDTSPSLRAREGTSATAKPPSAPPAPRGRGRAPVPPVGETTQPDMPAAPAPPETMTPAPGPGLVDDALRSAGRIDRDLRQQMPWQGGGPSASSGTRLERSIAAAGKARVGATEQMTLGDGTRVTKVYGAGGVYCIYNRGVGVTAGRDVTQNGTQQFTANCPQ